MLIKYFEKSALAALKSHLSLIKLWIKIIGFCTFSLRKKNDLHEQLVLVMMLSEDGSFLNKFLRNKSSVYFQNGLLQFFRLFYFLNESYFREATCGFCIFKFWLFHSRYRSCGGMCKFVHFGSYWLHKNMCGQSLKNHSKKLNNWKNFRNKKIYYSLSSIFSVLCL